MIDKELSTVITDLQKLFGEDSVGNATELIKDLGSFSTGSVWLDSKLSGGYPIGRLSQIEGPPGAGKTTSLLRAIADCQSKGGKAIFMDLENSLDLTYARALGVNIEDLIFISPMAGERALSIAEKLCKTGDIDLLGIDSVAALLPGRIQEQEYGRANMAFHAKLVSEFTKRFVPIQYQNRIAIIVINQIRQNPGVMFGSNEYVTGGNSIPYFSSVRVDFRKKGPLEKDANGVVIGEPRKIKIVKSKINDSINKETVVHMVYGEGIDNVLEVISMSVDHEILEKKGAYYYYDDVNLGQGLLKAKQFFLDNPEVFEEIKQRVYDKAFTKLSINID